MAPHLLVIPGSAPGLGGTLCLVEATKVRLAICSPGRVEHHGVYTVRTFDARFLGTTGIVRNLWLAKSTIQVKGLFIACPCAEPTDRRTEARYIAAKIAEERPLICRLVFKGSNSAAIARACHAGSPASSLVAGNARGDLFLPLQRWTVCISRGSHDHVLGSAFSLTLTLSGT